MALHLVCINMPTIIVPVLRDTDYPRGLVSLFLEWSKNNCMTCNPSKCKELAFVKKVQWADL